MGGIGRLRNPIRDYAWGSRHAIAELLGDPTPSPGPQAELWMGAHAADPSQVRRGDDWIPLDALIREWQPERLIVGLPLNMDNTLSDMAKRAQRFAHRLNGRYGLPVEMRDERLTSQEARSLSDDPDARHAIAAQLILAAWLEDS